MNKKEFLSELRGRLSDLPEQEIEERLLFYSEMIDDRMEEGLSEEEAVKAIGSTDEPVIKNVADTPAVKSAKKKTKAWEIVLLVLGSPVWLSLLIAAIAVIFSLYISLWAVIISLWATFGAVIGCAVGGILGGICLAAFGNSVTGAAMIGVSVVCAGFAILWFYACKAATKGTVGLGKRLVKSFKKEAA